MNNIADRTTHAALESRLQSEIDAVVRKNKDVFNAVLGVADTRADFRWAGAAGTVAEAEVFIIDSEDHVISRGKFV